MINTIKNLIFSQINPSSEYEKKLRALINEKKGIQFIDVLQFFTIIFGLLLLKNVLRVGGTILFVYVVLLVIIMASFFAINFFKRKQRKSYHLLLQAIEFIRKMQYSLALDKMIEAYELSKNEDLLQIIKDFSAEYPPNTEQEILITEYILNSKKTNKNKNKDKKLQEILHQIQNVSEYILKHKKSIVNSKKKIIELTKNETNTSEERLKTEYKSLINRYDDIIELENSKIAFYSKAENQLIKLKNNHIENRKILLEKEELRNLEDNLLEKSIAEEYNTENNIGDFITYENAYLEAIEEFSEQISSTGDQNIFEDIIRSFNDKTEFL